ncbi:MAG: DUF1232 domain-containing protein [Gammaproteobacteria bacterium]|nr:DUF1232 domain-containing protein [Gammaproteobacteria bacterium]MDH3362211.1 DUF1232 domain-containing protein [Gammaproteobacteria bacterium]MDH3480360.1 DUF1232 domain-containing protein [Gammaproteobacteria bacterium]
MVKQVSKVSSNGDRPPKQGRVVGRMHREYRYYKALLDDPRTPTTAKWLIGGGVGYLLLPFDLIPDFIPVVGKLDDMLIAPAMIGLGMRLVPEGVKSEDRSRSRRVRILYDDKSMGPVLFESEALPGPFGIRIGTCGRDPETQGPVLFPLLDLMYEYGLVVITDNRQGPDRFDLYTRQAATNNEPAPCRLQIQLDVNFRPLPMVAAIMYSCSESNGADRFINSDAAYVALPKDLKNRIDALHLRWLPCSEIHIDAVVNNDGSLSCPRDAAHVVTGAQFINLLLNGECRIVDSNAAAVDTLLTELREHAQQEQFCYAHECVDGDLIAWNPRRVLHMPSVTSTKTPRFIYPTKLSGALLGE